MPLTISNVTDVYGGAAHCTLVRQWVEHPELAEFSCALRTLVQSLGEAATDEYWRKTLGPIRRLGFAFCSTPLPFSILSSISGINWKNIDSHVRRCQQLFPDSHNALVALFHQLESLSIESSSPFLEPLEALLKQNGSLAIVLRNSQMNQAVAEYFTRSKSLKNATVVSPLQLRGAYLSKTLAAIGPCGWFPEHVFCAPRVPAIHVISLRWIRDSWKPGPVFLHNSNSDGNNSNHSIGVMPKIRGEDRPLKHSSSEILPGDMLPPVKALGSGWQAQISQTGNGAEITLARICLLCDSRAVLVAADEDAKSLIIDMSEMDPAVVRRVPVGELEPGHYLLVRTSGGGDFIAPLANRILGDSAERRRSEQAEWKECLIAVATKKFGHINRRELSSCVSSELHARNLCQTRPANVHYWMSSKCIRPRKIEDFVAILTFAGLEKRAEQLWRAMGDIDGAHRKAGQLIRQMLLQKIATTSLEPLERDGEMVFDLGEQDGGTLSAFRITEIMLEELEVPVDRVGVLLELGDEPWPA